MPFKGERRVDSHLTCLQLFSSWVSRPEINCLCSFCNGLSNRNIFEVELQDTSRISIMWKHILSNSLSNVIVVNQVSREDRWGIWDLSSSAAFTSLEQVFLNFRCPTFAFVQVAKDFVGAAGFLFPGTFTLCTWKSHLGSFGGLLKFVWAFQMCGSCRGQTFLNWLLHAWELWMSALWAHTAVTGHEAPHRSSSVCVLCCPAKHMKCNTSETADLM